MHGEERVNVAIEAGRMCGEALCACHVQGEEKNSGGRSHPPLREMQAEFDAKGQSDCPPTREGRANMSVP